MPVDAVLHAQSHRHNQLHLMLHLLLRIVRIVTGHHVAVRRHTKIALLNHSVIFQQMKSRPKEIGPQTHFKNKIPTIAHRSRESPQLVDVKDPIQREVVEGALKIVGTAFAIHLAMQVLHINGQRGCQLLAHDDRRCKTQWIIGNKRGRADVAEHHQRSITQTQRPGSKRLLYRIAHIFGDDPRIGPSVLARKTCRQKNNYKKYTKSFHAAHSLTTKLYNVHPAIYQMHASWRQLAGIAQQLFLSPGLYLESFGFNAVILYQHIQHRPTTPLTQTLIVVLAAPVIGIALNLETGFRVIHHVTRHTSQSKVTAPIDL